MSSALVCDICGGKLIMKSGGVATCDSCGLEYSMDRVKEKVQEIKGTVVVDNSHLIENYYQIATNSYEAENYAESELYCNKIIENDPTNTLAWYLKGKAVGMQTTLVKYRLSETVVSFIQSINFADDNVKEDLVNKCCNDIRYLAKAIVELRLNHYHEFHDKDGADELIKIINYVLIDIERFSNKLQLDEYRDLVLKDICNYVEETILDTYNNAIVYRYVHGDYHAVNYYPDRYEWSDFIKDSDGCINVLLSLIDACQEIDLKLAISIYNELTNIQLNTINSCSWNFDYDRYGEKVWYEELSLTDDAKEARLNIVKSYQVKQNILREKKEKKDEIEAEKRRKRYWEENKERAYQLKRKENELIIEKNKLIQKFNNSAENIRAKEIDEELGKLQYEKDNIGLFNVREKKPIQDKINILKKEKKELSKILKPLEEALTNEIQKFDEKIGIIEDEFKKDR